MIMRHPDILLGLKKKGLGSGRWNGFGGKVESGESVEGAARREVKEETGIGVHDLAKMWADDKYWLPLLLAGKKFKGKVLFDRPSDAEYAGKILKKEINEVDSL
jgi:8-oxo-dGTP pyrophosphatase MutT (NUDIX family)